MEVEEELPECSVCFLVFSDPRKLDCSHTFCSSCLRHLLERPETSLCPLCRCPIAQKRVEDIPIDPKIAEEVSLLHSAEPEPSAPPASAEDLGLPAETPQQPPNPSFPTKEQSSFTKRQQPGLLDKMGRFFNSKPIRALTAEERAEGMCWGASCDVGEDEVPALAKQWMSTLWLLPGDLKAETVVFGEIRQVFLPFYHFAVDAQSHFEGSAVVIKRRRNSENKKSISLPGCYQENTYAYLVYAGVDESLRELCEEMYIDGNQLQLLPSCIEPEEISSVDHVYSEHVDKKVLKAEESKALRQVRSRCVRQNVVRVDLVSIDTTIDYDESLCCVPFYFTSYTYGGTEYKVLIHGVSGMATGTRPYGGGMISRFVNGYLSDKLHELGEWMGLVDAKASSNNNNNNS